MIAASSMYALASAIFACAVLVTCEEDLSKYEGINFQEALKNERLYKAYFNCLVDRGPCTREGKILKEALPEGLKNNCSKCTEHQRKGTYQVMRYLYKHRPKDMEMLEEKYDPEGVYRTKYAAEREKIIGKSEEEKDEEEKE